jgi:peptide chain release factor 3
LRSIRRSCSFAQDREIADTAEPGDIIGIPNHGTLRVGDTLSERNEIRFTGLPNFAPEILRRVVLRDPTKTKQLRKALDDLSEEGVIQVFLSGNRRAVDRRRGRPVAARCARLAA